MDQSGAGGSPDLTKTTTSGRHGSFTRQLGQLFTRLAYGVAILLVAGATYSLLTDPGVQVAKSPDHRAKLTP